MNIYHAAGKRGIQLGCDKPLSRTLLWTAMFGLICNSVSIAQQTAIGTESVGNLWTRPAGEDWPSFLGVGRNGRCNETGILKDWSDGRLRLVWTTPIGQGYCSGAVSRGRFLQFDAIDNQARIRCLNAETGDSIWEFKYPSEYRDLYGYDSGPRSSPIIDDDRVYCFGVEGLIHCLSLQNGRVIWKLDTSNEFGVIQNFFGVGSTPTIHQDQLYVMVGGSPAKDQQVPAGRLDRVSPNGSAIVVINKLDGKIESQLGNDLASYSSIRMTTQGDQTVGYAWARNHLIAFDPDGPSVMWQFPWRARKLESVNAMTPVIDGDTVLISESYGPGSVLLRNKGDQPEVIWSDEKRRDKALETHWNTPVLHEGMLYASSGQHKGNATIRCLEVRSGKIRWSQKGFARASLTYVDQHLIVLDEDGELFLIKATPKKFDMVTAYRDKNANPLSAMPPCWAAPIVSHGLLYVRSRNMLYCFDLIPEPSRAR